MSGFTKWYGLIIATGLAACAGGSNSNSNNNNNNNDNYYNLASGAVGGEALVSGSSPSISTIEATWDRDSSTLSFSATPYSGGTVSLLDPVDSPYEYVISYSLTYTQSGTNYEALGFAGSRTPAGDIPTTGRATYAGIAWVEGTFRGTSLGPDGLTGTSSVDVDFSGDGNIGVSMDFADTDTLVQIWLNKMLFSKTDRSMFLEDGNSQGTAGLVGPDPDDPTNHPTLTYAGHEYTARGQFYGVDENLFGAGMAGPDEVAGVFQLVDNFDDIDINLQARFVAD